MDLDQTQALDLGDYDDEIGSDDEEKETSSSKKLVAHLKVFSHQDFMETIFPLYEGENIIGREENCCVFIPLKALSKKHAVIEIDDSLHLIHDCGSKNRTRKEKVFLRPKIRYELKHGDMLTLADVRCQYLIGPLAEEEKADDEPSDTSSETGSESMLPTSQDEETDYFKETTNLEKIDRKEEKEDWSSNDKVSVAHTSIQKLQEEVYAADTDDETDDDDDDVKVPIFTPGRPPIKGSDDEEEEKTFDKSEKNNNAELQVDKNTSKDDVDNEKSGEESKKPDLKLILESESDEDVSPTNRCSLPQSPSYDDTTDDEQLAATAKKISPYKHQVGSAGETLAFGLRTPENIIRPRESEKTQSVEATLPVTPESHEKNSSHIILQSRIEKVSEAAFARTLMYSSDGEEPSTAHNKNMTKGSSMQCPATLICTSEEEDAQEDKQDENEKPQTTGEIRIRYSDEELSHTKGGEDLEKGAVEDVDLCGPTLLYTSGEEIPTSPLSPSAEKDKMMLDDTENNGTTDNKGDDKAVDAGDEKGSTKGDSEDFTDPDATQVYNLDNDSTDDEDLLIATTQAYETLTSKRTLTERDNEDQLLAATQPYQDVETGFQKKTVDDEKTQAYSDETGVETTNLEATLAYEVPTQLSSPLDTEGGEGEEDLQQTQAYGVQDVEQTQAYGAGEDVQTLAYGIDLGEEPGADELCEATQPYGLDDQDSHSIVETEDIRSKPSTSGMTFQVDVEVVPDSQDIPVTPVVKEKEEKTRRRVTFAEVSEVNEEEMEISEDQNKTPNARATKASVTTEGMDDSEEDFVRPKGRKTKKTPMFLDSQESDSGDTEDFNIKDDPSSSNEKADTSNEAADDGCVEKSPEQMTGTRRISKRGTKKPYVEIVPVTEPNTEEGRTTRGKKEDEQHPVLTSKTPGEEGFSIGLSRGRRQNKTRGKQSKAAKPISVSEPKEQTKSSASRRKRGGGRQSQVAGEESSEPLSLSLSVQGEEDLVPSAASRNQRQPQVTEAELATSVKETSAKKGKRGTSRLSKASKSTREEDPPEETQENPLITSKRSRGRQSEASEPTEGDNKSDEIPQTSVPEGKKSRGKQPRASEPTEKENPSEDITETSSARGKRGLGRHSKASETNEEDNIPDMIPESSGSKDKRSRGRRSRAAEQTREENQSGETQETPSVTCKRVQRQSKGPELAEADNSQGEILEASGSKEKKTRGRKSRAAKQAELEKPADYKEEPLQLGRPKGRGKQSKSVDSIGDENAQAEMSAVQSKGFVSQSGDKQAIDQEILIDEITDAPSTRRTRGVGRKSTAAEPTELVPFLIDTPESSLGRGTRGRNKQLKAEEPCKSLPADGTVAVKGDEDGLNQAKAMEDVFEGTPKATPVRSKRGPGKKSNAAELESMQDCKLETNRRSRGRGKQPKKSLANERMEEPSLESVSQEQPMTLDTDRGELNNERQFGLVAAENSESIEEVSLPTSSSVSVKGRGRGKNKLAKISRPSTSRAILEQIPTDEDAEDELPVVDTPSRRSGRSKGSRQNNGSKIKDHEETAKEVLSEAGPSNRRGKQVKTARARKGASDESETPDSSQTLSLPDTSSQSAVPDSQESTPRRGRGRKRQTDQSPNQQKLGTPSKRGRKQALPNAVDSPTTGQRKSNDSKPRVMFTGLLDKRGEKIVKSLGGELVDSVYSCTHLVTDKVRRTVKFLCGVASGQMVVLPSWLDACSKAKDFVDSRSFFVKDKDAEKQYNFSLERSLERAGERGLLEGYKVHVTPHVKPEAQQMKDIIQCAKGEFLPRVPRHAEENLLVVSCEEDRHSCQPCLNAAIPVYTAELLLTGILRQELDLEEYRLFTEDGNTNETNSTEAKKRGRESAHGSSASTGSSSSKRRKR